MTTVNQSFSIRLLQTLAIISFIIFPLLMLFINQISIYDYSFAIVMFFSCLIGLLCAFTLWLYYELPTFAFPGIAIHLFVLTLITCC